MTTLSFTSRTTHQIRKTEITVITVDSQADAVQLSLFAYESWVCAMMATMRKFTEFYPSEVAQLCDHQPPHSNAIGTFYRSLIRSGKISRTGAYRPSPRSGRNGGVEFQYRNNHINVVA